MSPKFLSFVLGCWDLSMPDLRCEVTWTAGVHDLNLNVFWSPTLQFSTVNVIDVFFSFEVMKMVTHQVSANKHF